MNEQYILSIDQSTQGTKALLFDTKGHIVCMDNLPHQQMVNHLGWVEHNPTEIYKNLLQVVKNVVVESGIQKEAIKAVGICNQRETAMAWDRETGRPLRNAVVWQCARGKEICDHLEEQGQAKLIHDRTGLRLSPYFSAAKLSWLIKNVPAIQTKAEQNKLCFGTMDSWVVYMLTNGSRYVTDYSNASRTQLFNIKTLAWDETICSLFNIPTNALPQVIDSNGDYGFTDFDGFFASKIPIRAVLGDSHSALFGQGCFERGMTKATYGTGSSIMMNIGETPIISKDVVTSLGWCINGKVQYVLEGNINYTGAVISWLKNDLELINNAKETEQLAYAANQADTTYIVPAFSGLQAPYWDTSAKASICGITRSTKKAEIVKAGLECIAYQIADVVNIMCKESQIALKELRVDGGATGNAYLMQFQSDILGLAINVADLHEISGTGVAYLAGITTGICDKEEFLQSMNRSSYTPKMDARRKVNKCKGWRTAVKSVLSETK